MLPVICIVSAIISVIALLVYLIMLLVNMKRPLSNRKIIFLQIAIAVQIVAMFVVFVTFILMGIYLT